MHNPRLRLGLAILTLSAVPLLTACPTPQDPPKPIPPPLPGLPYCGPEHGEVQNPQGLSVTSVEQAVGTPWPDVTFPCKPEPDNARMDVMIPLYPPGGNVGLWNATVRCNALQGSVQGPVPPEAVWLRCGYVVVPEDGTAPDAVRA